MLLIFRATSNQRGIRKTKDRIKAHLLEVRLFSDNVLIMLSALKNLLIHNMKYLGNAIIPMLCMFIPVSLILIQLNTWYGYTPLKPGETTVFSVKLAAEVFNLPPDIRIKVDNGIRVETPPLYIIDSREVEWRIRAEKPGEHKLQVAIMNQSYEKTVTVSNRLSRVSPRRVISSFRDVFFNPGEVPIAKGSLIEQMSIIYPDRSIQILGWKAHWLFVFFLLSISFGFILKKPFRVEL